MSSRKESLKKSLGITEYPWSSDDDLDEPNTSTAPDVSAFRHTDPRPPTDIPGPSGLQPSQVAPATWRQAKYDRDLFWSILNSPCNPVKSGTPPYSSPISRQVREDATIPGRLMHAPAADHTRSTRGSNVPDVQRILAFKRLTRNFNTLRNRSAPSSSSGSRGNSGSGLLSSDLPGVRAGNHRHQMTMRRFQPARSVLSVYRNGSSIGAPSNFPADEQPMALTTRGAPRPRSPGARAGAAPAPPRPASPLSPLSPPRIQGNNNMHNDHEEADNPGPSTSQSILADEVNLIQDEPSDLEISGNNTSGMSLEEEIVEIDADEAPSPTFSPTQPASAPIDLDVDEQPRDPNVSTTSSRGGEPSNQPSKQGVKRKRQDSDDNCEPYTVKEYNQELLRLLECPVCLEWMEPPMSQCRRGHLVCGRCRTRLNACPVCRTTFSSVRNRAMEGVAEMVRYPCRHGCGREVRLRRRAPHEASCSQRKYQCPAPACTQHAQLPRHLLADHFQSKHLPMLKIGNRHKFSIKMSTEQHDNWLILAMDEYFHLRIDVDIRVFVYVSYIGPKCDANNFIYEVTVEGQHHSRKLVYARSTHCDLESPIVNVSREDCFSVSLDQALNFIRFKNRRCDADKYLDFNVEISKIEPVKEESDS